MRIAALYDIHGNLGALEAVLEEVCALGVDEVVVGGDVLPGPLPEACLSRLDDLLFPVAYLFGNGETDGLCAARGEPLSRVPEAFHEPVRWSAEQLPAGRRAEVAAWPAVLHREIRGVGTVLFCHATPRDDNEIFTAITPEDRLLPVFQDVTAEIVVCGHTHMQFDRRIGRVRVINAGSIGMPFGPPRADWMLLGPGSVEFRHTEYDLDDAAAQIQASGYPGELDVHRPTPSAVMQNRFEQVAIGRR